MKNLQIKRVEKSESGFLGILFIEGIWECVTLNPDPTDKHLCIPPGSYLCKRYHSKKFPDTFEILVPGHSKVLFHILNTEEETEGCIGLGRYPGYLGGRRFIFDSGIAFKKFMKKMGSEQKFNLVIEDFI